MKQVYSWAHSIVCVGESDSGFNRRWRRAARQLEDHPGCREHVILVPAAEGYMFVVPTSLEASEFCKLPCLDILDLRNDLLEASNKLAYQDTLA